MIRRRGTKYELVSKETGRRLGLHKHLADARAQEAAIQIAKSQERKWR